MPDAHTVDDSKINRLGAAAHFIGHFFHRQIIDIGGGEFMDINAFFESLNHFGVFGRGGQNPELNLRIIKRREGKTCGGDKRVPDFRAEIAPDRNILEIRLFRRKPARNRAGLFQSRVDFPVF